MKRYILYWAHLPTETDIRTQGYVGVTSQLMGRRILRHRADEWKSWAWDEKVMWEVIECNLSKHEAWMIEEFYRPHRDIGYNLDKGGKPVGCNHLVRTSYTRNVTKPYKGVPFFIDDMEFRNKQDAIKWLVENNICSDRTAQRRVAGVHSISLDKCQARGR